MQNFNPPSPAHWNHSFEYSRVTRDDKYLKSRAAELGVTVEALAAEGIRSDEYGNICFQYFDEFGNAIYLKNVPTETHPDQPDDAPAGRLRPLERIRRHPDEIPRLEQQNEAHSALLDALAADPDGMAATLKQAFNILSQDNPKYRQYWIDKRDAVDEIAARAGLVCNFLAADPNIRKALATSDAWGAHKIAFNFFELMARNYTPAAAALKLRPTKIGKYTQPKGEGVRPYIPPATWAAKRRQPIIFTEGEFKALAVALSGIPAIAFAGISVYKLCPVVRAAIFRITPPDVYITYDADALEARRNNDGHITDGRARDFGIVSAYKLAKQLFDFQDETGLKFGVHLVAVKQGVQGKGIDDVMNAAPTRTEVLKDLIRAEDPRYFQRIKLNKSTLLNRIESAFALTNHREFYARHAAGIKLDPFIFGGVQYQAGDAGDLFKSVPFFRMNTNPFHIALPSVNLHLKRGQYLTSLADELDQVIQANLNVCLSSPPNSGKTTFAVQAAKRLNRPVVIAVPTRAIAKQYKKYKGVTVLSGSLSISLLEAARNAGVIVCTYEHLAKVTDISRRILFVDESQNLARQFGTKGAYFRAEVLRQIVGLFPTDVAPDDPRTAKRAVLLSGTMPRTIPYIFNCKLVEVTSDNAPRVNLTAIEATSKRKIDMRALLATALQKDAQTKGKPVFVLYNDCEALEALAAFLVASGAYAADEIAILTSPRYRNGENEVFDYIAANERVPNHIRLVLTTCLIAEGVNIKNKNIGNVYTVGLDHVLILQFIKRFRKCDTLNVFAILPPESKTRAGFTLTALDEIDEDIKIGELSVQFLTKRIRRRADELVKSGYGECLNDVLTEDFCKSEASLRYAYITQDERTGRPVAMMDHLQILADVHRREYEQGNNAYCLTRLLETAGWRLSETTDGEADQKSTEALEAEQSAIDDKNAAAMDEIQSALYHAPAPVCSHLETVYRDGRARDQLRELEELTAAAEIDTTGSEDAAAVFALTAGGQAITKGVKNARITVLHWLELKRAGVPRDQIRDVLQTWTRAQLKDWTRAVKDVRARRNAGNGTHMDEIQRFNIMRLEIVIEAIATVGAHGRPLSAKQIHDAAQKSLSRIEATKHGEVIHTKIDRITQAEALIIAKANFKLERSSYHREHLYKIGQPWALDELEALPMANEPLTFCKSVTPLEKQEKTLQRVTRSFIIK